MLGGGGGSGDDSDLDKPGWRITCEMMDRVDSLDWQRLELGDGGLQHMIFDIDEADLKALRSRGGADATGGGEFRVQESDEGRP